MKAQVTKRYLLMFSGLILVVFAAVALWPGEGTEGLELPNFESRLASNLKNWTWEDRPLAESEEVIDSIGERLAFDDAVYRVYKRLGPNAVSVAVWVAYWHPGKVDITDVHTHEPDSCWVHGGWTIDQRSDDYVFAFPDGRTLRSAKYRLMAKPSGKVHVAFWHLVGDTNLKIERWAGTAEKYPEIIRQTGFRNRSEQYFLRLSSTSTFEDLMSDPEFRMILESVAQFGLHHSEE